ncbi:hypothetical protein RKD56_006077 [Priestia megaterium]|jgi:hypothetical protein
MKVNECVGEKKRWLRETVNCESNEIINEQVRGN